ncbi:1-aminocyclopropane-1-carboxylate deaminase [Sphaerisporangium siamense]|uniref:Isopenicillin N synthase-like dioxygenase n=1 Tax=Sphaerisporangium siamense TaxID=795645 RepID=A0A7W7GBP9_9ACTN|nr:isopenicillin N synthase family oxygenase [Sphaerisporangium siamense]MBB4703732.1 isopenicillin N synthase-like dioxygenase [Sphaerisporangium siamense]GII82200.1 1-aminocyclopropane-1-carboxylate deaminase [Sphaerisporangium siamense]
MTQLRTFTVPASVTGQDSDARLAKDMIRAWQEDGVFQVATRPRQDALVAAAYAESGKFFARPQGFKAGHVSDLSYSGYTASGEEVTAGRADSAEIFTVCKDLPDDDPRVRDGWPCHGPVPWPGEDYRRAMTVLMHDLTSLGTRLLRLTALGLGLADLDVFTRLTHDGWHHMRVLRLPAVSPGDDRGTGGHTDHGLLVIASHDDTGGLYVRPPVPGERPGHDRPAGESTAGAYEEDKKDEDDDGWAYVPPVPRVLTVFPGDIMRFMTGGALPTTPHKVPPAPHDRHALAYFHEPGFQSVARPLTARTTPGDQDHIHYGTHVTAIFMRGHPRRVTTARIHAEGRLAILEQLRAQALGRPPHDPTSAGPGSPQETPARPDHLAGEVGEAVHP